MKNATIHGYVMQLQPSYSADGFIKVNSSKDLEGQSGVTLGYDLKKTKFTVNKLPVIIICNKEPYFRKLMNLLRIKNEPITKTNFT